MSLSFIPPRSPPIPANAELLPANEKELDFTAIPNTLNVGGAPKAVKSVTTSRGDIPGGSEDEGEPNTVLLSGNHGGIGGE